jgi:putative RecB family exonuclease
MKKAPKHLKPLLDHKEEPINWDTDKIVSYSQFSTWKQCPHKWKLQNVDKLKNPPSIHLIFGTAIHTALQHYLKVMYDQSGAAADREDIVQLFEDNFREEYKKGYEKNNNTHFSNAEEMGEFFEDGKTILEYFRRKKGGYFSTRKTHLIGIEFPLSYAPHEEYPNVKYRGFIDIILYNENTEKLYIYDIKTSTRGWKDKDKKDETKASQVLLYKEYLSKIFDWDVSKIEVEFFIVKRKIWEESEFPIPRIQQFVPPSGTRKRLNATESFRTFIEDCFDNEGKPQVKTFTKNVSELCAWCQFKDDSSLCNKVNSL